MKSLCEGSGGNGPAQHSHKIMNPFIDVGIAGAALYSVKRIRWWFRRAIQTCFRHGFMFWASQIVPDRSGEENRARHQR